MKVRGQREIVPIPLFGFYLLLLSLYLFGNSQAASINDNPTTKPQVTIGKRMTVEFASKDGDTFSKATRWLLTVDSENHFFEYLNPNTEEIRYENSVYYGVKEDIEKDLKELGKEFLKRVLAEKLPANKMWIIEVGKGKKKHSYECTHIDVFSMGVQAAPHGNAVCCPLGDVEDLFVNLNNDDYTGLLALKDYQKNARSLKREKAFEFFLHMQKKDKKQILKRIVGEELFNRIKQEATKKDEL